MKLTPFSYVVLVLVGEGGAGAHDLVRMMRVGRVYWAAAESQWYAEPKKLAEAGYLDAEQTPGKTNARTHYTLTKKGRKALADWVATPSAAIKMQNEPVVRALAGDIVDPEATAAGLESLRADLEAARENIATQKAAAADLPKRESLLLINHRLADKLVIAQVEWLDEIQEELRRRARR